MSTAAEPAPMAPPAVSTQKTEIATPAKTQTDDPPAPQNDGAPQGLRLYAVAVGVCFGALMMSLDISIIATV